MVGEAKEKKWYRKWWGCGGIIVIIICGFSGLMLVFGPSVEELNATKTLEAGTESAAAATASNIALTPTDMATSSIALTPTDTAMSTTTWTRTATPRRTATSTMSATLNPFEQNLSQIKGVQYLRVVYFDGNATDGYSVYLEIDTYSSYNTQQTADALRQASYAALGSAKVEFSAIIWDGSAPAIDWIWDNETDSWRKTILSTAPEATVTPGGGG